MKKHFQGRDPRLVRMFNEQARICPYCGDTMTLREGPKQATIEDIVPRSRGGRGLEFNKMAACITCNRARGNMPLAKFLISIRHLQHA